MRSYLTLIVCAVILVFALWQVVAPFFRSPYIKNFPPTGTRIVALGDSLTVGMGASAPELGLIPQLEKRTGTKIINRGVSGNTTREALERLSRDVILEKPNIVIVLLGGNDYLRKVPQKETFTNLRLIINEIQSDGSVVLLLGIQGGILTDQYEEDFEELARETGSLFAPNVLDGILGNTTLMSDAIHPNDRGYEKMVDRIAPSVLHLILGATKRNTTP